MVPLHARVQAGLHPTGRRAQSNPAVGRKRGLVEQTLFNWVQAGQAGQLSGAEHFFDDRNR